jgi:hypothetical protein
MNFTERFRFSDERIVEVLQVTVDVVRVDCGQRRFGELLRGPVRS